MSVVKVKETKSHDGTMSMKPFASATIDSSCTAKHIVELSGLELKPVTVNGGAIASPNAITEVWKKAGDSKCVKWFANGKKTTRRHRTT